MGGAAAYHLAKAGAKVIAFDQFKVPNELGSSHSESRIIRKSYFEHPDYIPLLNRAYELWESLEVTPGDLLVKNGLFIAGEQDRPIMQGVVKSAKTHGIPIEIYSSEEAQAKFLGFEFKKSEVCIFEPGAGYLKVERCLHAHLEGARSFGAEIFEDTRVKNICRDGSGFKVKLDGSEVSVRKLVISAGPWASGFLEAKFMERLVPFRVPLFWFRPKDDRLFAKTCFAFDLPEGFFYGFPPLSAYGSKLALHKTGMKIEDIDRFSRAIPESESAPFGPFLRDRIPHLQGESSKEASCIYTMTPDEHFIVDEDRGLVVLAGFSGHGFKFASVMGEVAKDLVLNGKTVLPIDFLKFR